MPGFRTGHPRCRLVLNADVTYTGFTNFVSWGAAAYDDVGMWGGTTDVVLDRDGLWQIRCHATRSAQASNQPALVRPYVNGVAVGEGRSGVTTQLVQAETALALELAAGDVVKMWVQLSTVNTTVLQKNYSYLEVIRIGPKRWV